jgi:hypothetical protein
MISVVRQMDAIVHPYRALRKMTCVIVAYFDETGTCTNKTGLFILCGYIAPSAEWERDFEPKWRALLDHPCRHSVDTKNVEHVCRPLDYLHAKEMEGLGNRRFRRIGQRNRDYLVNASVTAISSSGIIGVASYVSLDAYWALDEKPRTIIGNPYELCFQHLVIQAAKKAQAFLGEDKSENIAYVFERNPRWEVLIHSMYSKLLAEGAGPKYRMGTLTFAEKREFIPLQAADRLAYETYKYVAELERRPQFQRLMEWPQQHGGCFDERGFGLLVAELIQSGMLN